MVENESIDFVSELGFQVEGAEKIQNPNPGAGAPGDLNPKEIFGEEFESWEKVKTEIPERLKKFSEIQQELEGYKSKNFGYLNEDIGEFDKFVSLTGKKDFGTFQKFKESNLEGIDALVFKTILENPELQGKEDILKSRFLQEYKQDPTMYDETEIALNKAKFNSEVAKAFEYLNDIKQKTKVENASVDPEVLKQKKAERINTLKQALEEEFKQVSKIPIPMFDEENKKEIPLFEFEIKDDVRSKFLEPLAEAFQSYGQNDEVKNLMRSEYITRVIVDRLPSIMATAYKTIEAKIRSEIEAEYGGQVRQLKPPGGGGGSGVSDLDKYLDSN